MTYHKIMTMHTAAVHRDDVATFMQRMLPVVTNMGATHAWLDLDSLPDVTIVADVPDGTMLGENVHYAEAVAMLAADVPQVQVLPHDGETT